MTTELSANQVKYVLFVCMGNICRSPTAEAVFRQKAANAQLKLNIDSAGTTGAHAKQKPDHRAIKVGESRNYSFKNLKARKVTAQDFDTFDMVLAMDNANVKELMKVAPPHLRYKIELFLDYAENYPEQEVPDPYYGGPRGFQFVLDLVEDASDGLLKKLTS